MATWRCERPTIAKNSRRLRLCRAQRRRGPSKSFLSAGQSAAAALDPWLMRVAGVRLVTAVFHALERTVRPPVTATLEIPERPRRKLIGIHKRIVGDSTGVSGKTERQGYGSAGPIALGYICHFGLGLFMPVGGVQG